MIKKFIPKGILKLIPKWVPKLFDGFYKKSQWIGNTRVFCITVQKTGTTSVGGFLPFFKYIRRNSSLIHNRIIP